MGGIKYCINRLIGNYIPIGSKYKCFNWIWYWRQHSDECRLYNAFHHYVAIGWRKGYEPCRDFQTWRLSAISDIYKKNPKVSSPLHCLDRLSDFKEHIDYDCDYSQITLLAANFKKKVLLISHELSNTGAPRALLYLAKHLKERGDNPFVLSLAGGCMRKDFEAEGIPCVVPENVVRDVVMMDPGLFHFVQMFEWIIFNTLYSLPFASALRDIKARKTAWIHEGFLSYEFRLSQATNIQHLFKGLNQVLFVSEYSRIQATKYIDYNFTSRILSYGIPDEGGMFVTIAGECVKILIAGSVDWRKGHHLLFNALSSLPHEYQKQIELYVAGKVYEQDAVVVKAIRKSTFKNVKMLGLVPHNELIEMIKKVDVIAAPSLDDPLPIVCTEAMMCAKPVLVSTSTGTARVIQDGVHGFIFDAGNEDSLKLSLAEIIHLKDELPKMGIEARKLYVERFSLESFKKASDECFQSV